MRVAGEAVASQRDPAACAHRRTPPALDGAIEADLLVTLARRNKVPLPTYDPAQLQARYVFGELQDFLDVYYANLQVRTEQDFFDLATLYLRRPARRVWCVRRPPSTPPCISDAACRWRP